MNEHPEGRELMLDRLSVNDFEGRTGETFTITLASGESLGLELSEVRGLTGDTPEGSRRSPFSLLLRGPGDGYLPQRIYELEHPQMGKLILFLVPLGPDREGKMRYEVVFS